MAVSIAMIPAKNTLTQSTGAPQRALLRSGIDPVPLSVRSGAGRCAARRSPAAHDSSPRVSAVRARPISALLAISLFGAAVLVACAGLATLPTQALAWANGPYSGNGYGTHDWVLDNALRIAGERGDWVDSRTAMLASDDPDSYGTKNFYHLFRDKGLARGSAQKISDLYYLAVTAYQRGDTQAASKYVGQLSHYYADTLQPFHTDYRALAYQSGSSNLHLRYELAVDGYNRRPGQHSSWVVPRERHGVSDIRRKTVSAAYYSRARFSRLLSALKRSSSVTTGDTNLVTRDVMSRASNDLADIIASVPTGRGLAPAPVTVRATMRRYYPARYTKACAYARCLDSNGNPMQGVAVRFTWELSSGSVSAIAYTDAKGVARHWKNIGKSPLMRKTTVTASATSSGTTRSDDTWFMATPVLDDGRDGIRTAASDHSPERYSTVSVSTVCRDSAGRPVAGLPVTFAWKHRTTTLTYRTVTNSRGVARQTRNIGGAAAGYRVYVRARTQSGGVNRSSTSSFVPE